MASVSTRSCQGPELARPYGARGVAEFDFTSLVTVSAMMASFSGYKPTQLEELTGSRVLCSKFLAPAR